MTTDLSWLIDDRPADGVFRINRAIFRDPELFDLEMRHIFEGGWVFLGLAAQAPAAHDFFTTQAGRVPILVMRDGDGHLRAFVNSCPHKGAQVAQTLYGNARLHVCPYHSWTFDSAGRNRGIKWQRAGCYADGFDRDSHDLAALPRFAERAGFLFGSLVADVPPLAELLGEAGHFLDLVVGQLDEGIELVPGAVSFTFDANWKLQLENCSDAYHFTSAHPSYIKIMERRQRGEGATILRAERQAECGPQHHKPCLPAFSVTEGSAEKIAIEQGFIDMDHGAGFSVASSKAPASASERENRAASMSRHCGIRARWQARTNIRALSISSGSKLMPPCSCRGDKHPA